MSLKSQKQRDVVEPPSVAVGHSPRVAAARLKCTPHHSPLEPLVSPLGKGRQCHKQGYSLASSRLWYPLLALNISVAIEISPGVFQPESRHRHTSVHNVQHLCSPTTLLASKAPTSVLTAKVALSC